VKIYVPKSISLEHPLAGPQSLPIRHLLAAELAANPPTAEEVQTYNASKQRLEELRLQLDQSSPDRLGDELLRAQTEHQENPSQATLDKVTMLAARRDPKAAERAHLAATEAMQPLIDGEVGRLRPLALRIVNGAWEAFRAASGPFTSAGDGLRGLLDDKDLELVSGFISDRIVATEQEFSSWSAWIQGDGAEAFLRDRCDLPERLPAPAKRK
jgi:hypothetical protein